MSKPLHYSLLLTSILFLSTPALAATATSCVNSSSRTICKKQDLVMKLIGQSTDLVKVGKCHEALGVLNEAQSVASRYKLNVAYVAHLLASTKSEISVCMSPNAPASQVTRALQTVRGNLETGDCEGAQKALTVAEGIIAKHNLYEGFSEGLGSAYNGVESCVSKQPMTAEALMMAQKAIAKAQAGECETAQELLTQVHTLVTQNNIQDQTVITKVVEAGRTVSSCGRTPVDNLEADSEAAQHARDAITWANKAACEEAATSLVKAKLLVAEHGIHTGTVLNLVDQAEGATQNCKTRSPTKIVLSCNDTSGASTLYKTIAGRCGEKLGLIWWNNDLKTQEMDVVKQTFSKAYDKTCTELNAQPGVECNTALLCQPGYTYVTNGDYCVSY